MGGSGEVCEGCVCVGWGGGGGCKQATRTTNLGLHGRYSSQGCHVRVYRQSYRQRAISHIARQSGTPHINLPQNSFYINC